MKKSNLFLVAALVAVTAFPVVKSLKGFWKRSPDETDTIFLITTSKPLLQEQLDHESKNLKETLIVGSNPQKERPNSLQLYTYTTMKLLDGKSSKELLKDTYFKEKLNKITDPETKKLLLKAISERLKSAENRFSPSKNSFGFGTPKIFSSRDQAQIMTASIISKIPKEKKELEEFRNAANDLRQKAKVFLNLATDPDNGKKMIDLQKRTYHKTLQEIAKQFKNPGNQLNIVQFLKNNIETSNHHEIQEGIEENLSKKQKKTFKKLWNQEQDKKTKNLSQKGHPSKKKK